MGVKDREDQSYTIAIAVIDRFIADIHDYVSKIGEVKDFVSRELKLHHHTIDINTADHYEHESIYLTVSGTSAEAGDDGEVGRGNRVNGLITPYRPMSLEAVSGKNPISHVGKIYNHFAFDLSKALYDHQFATEAQVYIVSQIGKPINEPQLLHLRLREQRGSDEQIKKLSRQMLAELPSLWKKLLLSGNAFGLGEPLFNGA
jgi:S-adenosylmethionine synthetase